MNWRKCDTIVGVLGDHSLDKDYIGSYGIAMSREKDGMGIFDTKETSYTGGGAGNIVDLLQEWGVRVLPCGVWNPLEDDNSKKLYNIWMEGFVNSKHMILGNGTPAYVKYYTDIGEHIFRANEVIEPPIMKVQHELVRHIQCLSEEVDILIVADYDENGEGILTPLILNAIREYITCPIIGMSRQRISLLKGLNGTIILDEEELINHTGSKLTLDRISRIYSLFMMTKAKEILLTLRGVGAALYNKPNHIDNTHYSDIKETLVRSQEAGGEINTCGCGDTFVAAYTICYSSGMDSISAIKRANAAARVQCYKTNGARVISNQEWDSEYNLLYGEEK